MAPLMFLTSVLLASSGALKARSKVRAGLGFPWLPLAELATALLLAALGLRSSLDPVLGFWIVIAAVALAVVSSVQHVLRAEAVRKRREASEGARLSTYVKYLSGSGPGE